MATNHLFYTSKIVHTFDSREVELCYVPAISGLKFEREAVYQSQIKCQSPIDVFFLKSLSMEK